MNKVHLNARYDKSHPEHQARDGLGAALARELVTSWVCSWRFRIGGPQASLPRQYVLAVPHASLLIASSYCRNLGMAAMVSRSGDGEEAARLLCGLGYRVVRGSSSHGGGRAFREMVRMGRAGCSLALTVDGPRGPAWRPKPGVVALAEVTGLPILPMVAVGPGVRWRSWDRLCIPWPFARCTVAFGEPFEVRRGSDREEALIRLEKALRGLSAATSRRGKQ